MAGPCVARCELSGGMSREVNWQGMTLKREPGLPTRGPFAWTVAGVVGPATRALLLASVAALAAARSESAGLFIVIGLVLAAALLLLAALYSKRKFFKRFPRGDHRRRDADARAARRLVTLDPVSWSDVGYLVPDRRGIHWLEGEDQELILPAVDFQGASIVRRVWLGIKTFQGLRLDAQQHVEFFAVPFPPRDAVGWLREFAIDAVRCRQPGTGLTGHGSGTVGRSGAGRSMTMTRWRPDPQGGRDAPTGGTSSVVACLRSPGGREVG